MKATDESSLSHILNFVLEEVVEHARSLKARTEERFRNIFVGFIALIFSSNLVTLLLSYLFIQHSLTSDVSFSQTLAEMGWGYYALCLVAASTLLFSIQKLLAKPKKMKKDSVLILAEFLNRVLFSGVDEPQPTNLENRLDKVEKSILQLIEYNHIKN